MEKILVTGGGGFIGSAVVKQLIAEGNAVRVFDLAEQINRNKPPKEAEIYKGSILDTNDLTNAMEGCSHVMHFAAMLGVKKTETRRLDCLTVNMQGANNILEGCVKDGVKKILFASSSEVYGEQEQNPIKETNPLNPKSIYAVTKLAGEEYVKAFKQRYKLDYTIARFFNVYGSGQVAEFVMSKFIKAVCENKEPVIYGKGDQVRAFCFVEDAARGAILALKSKKANSDVFNIGNNTEPITMAELAQKIIDLNCAKLKPKVIPLQKSDRSEEREINRRIPDISKAKEVLGYEPVVSLDEGIKKTIENGGIHKSWCNPSKM